MLQSYNELARLPPSVWMSSTLASCFIQKLQKLVNLLLLDLMCIIQTVVHKWHSYTYGLCYCP